MQLLFRASLIGLGAGLIAVVLFLSNQRAMSPKSSVVTFVAAGITFVAVAVVVTVSLYLLLLLFVPLVL